LAHDEPYWRGIVQHIVSGYRGLSLLVDLNWDRLLYLTTIVVALMAASFIGSL
jgi:hypothetical protein